MTEAKHPGAEDERSSAEWVDYGGLRDRARVGATAPAGCGTVGRDGSVDRGPTHRRHQRGGRGARAGPRGRTARPAFAVRGPAPDAFRAGRPRRRHRGIRRGSRPLVRRKQVERDRPRDHGATAGDPPPMARAGDGLRLLVRVPAAESRAAPHLRGRPVDRALPAGGGLPAGCLGHGAPSRRSSSRSCGDRARSPAGTSGSSPRRSAGRASRAGTC